MQERSDLIPYACDALSRLFGTQHEEFVKQALDVDFVNYLLLILDGNCGSVESTTKAQIVKALKAMCRSLLYGEQVSKLLAKSRVWSEYKDQKHDLFITGGASQAYLTAGVPTSAGYLTQSPSTSTSVNRLSEVPPPLYKEDLPLSGEADLF